MSYKVGRKQNRKVNIRKQEKKAVKMLKRRRQEFKSIRGENFS
jgi:hypothetical protein